VLGPLDDYYMAEGNHLRLYDKLGAHPIRHEGHDGVHFAVWAPNASRVSVVGDFNQWHTVKDGVLARVAGRLPVLARLQMLMEGIVAGLTRGDAFMAQGKLPLGDRGMSLVEAASDVLGHWLRIENGCIANYQIIALTTWNFSLRPARGQSDPLEGAKVAEGETAAPTIPHIVHSFDPCAVFTVH
jgi:Ni,Fe-hydrogenase I large subunit